MVSVLIRNVDEALHRRPKERTASHRRSVEGETREFLRVGVADLASRLLGAAHGAELDQSQRGGAPERAPINAGDGLWDVGDGA
jgi:plasmid stability protein